jgi:D-threo-aldose 1-dehydrogenase
MHVHDPDEDYPTALTEAYRALCDLRAAGVFQSGLLAEPRTGTAYGYADVPAALLARVQAVRAICARYGVPPLAAAIQFPFGHPAVATVVVGARAPHEVTDNAALLAHPISPELWNHMKAARLLPQDAPVPPPDA